MKLTILQENLKAVLTSLQKAVPSKPQLPILSSILITVIENEIELAATDLYLGIKAKIKAEVEKIGQVVVPGDVFKSLIMSLPPGEISLELKEKSLIVKTSKSKTSLPCQSSDEYPPFPKVEGDDFVLDTESLKAIDKHITFAATLDQTRPILTALLFNFSPDGLEVVSTDGFRLATLFLKDIISEESKSILIPAKAIKEVLRIALQQQVENTSFKVSEELKQVLFSIDNTEVFVRLIEGAYPPYEKIIPDSFAHQVEIDGEELTSQIKRAFVFARESSNIVRFEFSEENLIVKAASTAYGEYRGEMVLERGGKNNSNNTDEKTAGEEIAFNAVYLLDFLNTVKPEKIWLGMNESLKPVMLRPSGMEEFRYVVMPFRVNG